MSFLEKHDPELFNLIQMEYNRQVEGLELIASENVCSSAVLEALGSCLTNKYSEGQPGDRYYGGNEVIDQVEILCKRRALKAFNLSEDQWGVNVQAYSGTPANLAVYTGLLETHDRIMGLDLPSGGHLSHGFQSATKKVSATAKFFESLPYKVDPDTGYINYDEMESLAKSFRPKILIAGASAYPRDWDYARMKKIAKSVNAYLMADIAHISGLIASGEQSNPFEYCDIVTTTTHKTLRGPRAALIFYRIGAKTKKVDYDLQQRIDFAVFPGLQGGPHNNTIAAIATALKEVSEPEFKEYSAKVRKNAKVLANALVERGYSLVTQGTDNHLILWDLRPQKITGSKLENLLEMIGVSANKNAIYGDSNMKSPGGLRIGTPTLTSRGFNEENMIQVAEILDKAVKLGLKIQESMKTKKVTEFKKIAGESEEVKALHQEVVSFAKQFPIPGVALCSSGKQ